MPTIYAEGLFGTSLLNPSRRVPGFMREGGRGETDNERITPNFIAPCPRIHKHLNFSFTVSALLKIFVRSRRDWEKKCRIGIQQAHTAPAAAFLLHRTRISKGAMKKNRNQFPMAE
jgi:hypothetical protein